MNKKAFQTSSLVMAFVVAAVVSVSAVEKNYILPMIVIATAAIVLYAMKKNVKDILDDDRQGDLIKFLLAKVADFDQIMVFMTCTEPPDFVWEGNEMQVWWLENGAITKVAP